VSESSEQENNRRLIAEFHATRGQMSGSFQGAPVLLLHSRGARTAAERITPLMYQLVGSEFAVFASAAGRKRNPAWYYNLLAHPDIEIEVGAITLAAHARVAEPHERAGIWAAQKQRYPDYSVYESTSDRVIPVILLSARDH
jgi:deazaflavin-dependent oxidoreductase (nitroreductase family)